jgi:hypothetical protein
MEKLYLLSNTSSVQTIIHLRVNLASADVLSNIIFVEDIHSNDNQEREDFENGNNMQNGLDNYSHKDR